MDIRIKATPRFCKLASKTMSEEAIQELIDTLALHPDMGDIIRGTGGIRKVRWRTGKDSKGKSGGVRVLYYYEQDFIVLLITLFRKSDKENISASEKVQLKKGLSELLEMYKDK